MRGKRGFTVIEFLVVLAIIGVLLALLIPVILAALNANSRSSGWYEQRQTFVAQIVDSRQFWDDNIHSMINRIDVRHATLQPSVTPLTSEGLEPSNTIEVLDNKNDRYIEKYDAETIQVNAVPGWYFIEIVGRLDNQLGHYPNIVKMTRIPDPPPVAEINGLGFLDPNWNHQSIIVHLD